MVRLIEGREKGSLRSLPAGLAAKDGHLGTSRQVIRAWASKALNTGSNRV